MLSGWLLRRGAPAWVWSVLLCLSVGVFGSACHGPVDSNGGRNLLLGKKPMAAQGVSGVNRLTDGVSVLNGDDWETNLSARFADEESSVTYDLGAVVRLRSIWFESDHNDDYRFLISEDGVVFEELWEAAPVRAGGMQDRFTDKLDVTGRYLRMQPVNGDGRYAVAELAAFSELPAVFPPDPPRQRGTSLETMVRTRVLMFAAAAVAFLFFTFEGAPLWWLYACALLPLVAGFTAFESIQQAWPVEQQQVSMVRAASAAIAAFAVLRELYSPPRFPALRAAVVSCLGVSGLLAVLAFYNLGRPQFWDGQTGQPTPVHLLDLRQYYQTAKYFDEIGYRGMYLADMAAYVEDIPGATLDNLRDTPMRDLSNHRVTTIGEQRAKIEAIKQRFTPDRWQAYKRDARYFREMMGRQDYLRYMLDYGGNATPVWMSMAHFLFSAFDANTTGFLLTALLDPLLFAITFGAIGWCFGYRTMCVVMVVFGANDFIMYGSNWGGATLRHDWLMYIGLGACALRRGRPTLGGFFLALSSTIRAFPALTLVTACFPALWWLVEFWRRHERWPTRAEIWRDQQPLLRLLGGAAATALVLVLVTALRWSWPAWGDWFWKVEKLNADPHANSVALRGLIAGWEPGQYSLLRARWPLYTGLIAFYVLGLALAARRRLLEQAAISGLLLVPVVFYAANYYIHVICLLPLLALERRATHGDRPHVSVTDGWIWLTLLGLCVSQYWTVLVEDMPLHFHLATVLLFGALTAIVVALVRGDVREGRLDFLVRYLATKRTA